LVIQHLTTHQKLGAVKIANTNEVGGTSVIFITDTSESNLPNLKAYLESKVVRFIIQKAKITHVNAKYVFERIPDIDTSKLWTDEELYAHFNLSAEEISELEKWIDSDSTV
jgi:site-specific DNA-methyltransferase (adenine-specific)